MFIVNIMPFMDASSTKIEKVPNSIRLQKSKKSCQLDPFTWPYFGKNILRYDEKSLILCHLHDNDTHSLFESSIGVVVSSRAQGHRF